MRVRRAGGIADEEWKLSRGMGRERGRERERKGETEVEGGRGAISNGRIKEDSGGAGTGQLDGSSTERKEELRTW